MRKIMSKIAVCVDFSSYYLPSFASKIAFTRTNVETTKNNLTSVPVVDIMARMPNARKYQQQLISEQDTPLNHITNLVLKY